MTFMKAYTKTVQFKGNYKDNRLGLGTIILFDELTNSTKTNLSQFQPVIGNFTEPVKICEFPLVIVY